MKRKFKLTDEKENGLIVRDFISYTENNQFSAVISKTSNEWDAIEKKNVVKIILSSFLKKAYSKSKKEIRKIYFELIKEMSPSIIKQRNNL